MTVKSLLVKIGADVSEFNQNIGAAKNKFADLSAGMTRIGAGLTAAVTLPLLGVGAASIKMAMEAVESENLFEVSMGGMADAARTWSEDLRKQLGLNEYEIRKNVGTLYTMTSSMGLTKDAAYEVSTGFTKLAYDMASFYNLKPEEAFQKLRSGIAGEVEPLRQLGVMVDENTVKTYAYKNGIAAQGEELTVGQKVMARYGVIMAATSNAQGDLARTIDSPTNKLRVMKEQMKMTATELGMQLLPAFNALLGVGSKLVSGIGSVVKIFSSLPAPVKTVILVLAGLAAAAGPALIILAKMLPIIKAMPSALGMLKSGFALLLNPVTLLIAALAACAIGFYTLQDAEEKANRSAVIASEANKKLGEKLGEAAIAAGMTNREFAQLAVKYDNNAAAMAMAIQKGKEGVEIQQALAKVGKEHAAVIEEQRKKLEVAKRAQEEATMASDKAKASLEAMRQLRAALTDEIARATITETQYTLYSLDQQYQARVADIQRSAVSEQQKYALMLQARQAYDAQIAGIMAAATAADYAAAVTDRQNWLAVQAAANQEYLTMHQELQNGLNLMNLTGLQYELALLAQERAAKIAAIQENLLLNQTQKDELIAMLEEFYARKKELAEGDAAELTAIEQAAVQSIIALYQNLATNIIDEFAKIGAGGESLAEGLNNVFKSLAQDALSVVKSVVSATIAEARNSIASALGRAVANVIASVMALPFPLNLALVGGAIAAVSALFSRIKLGEGGLVTRPTTALIGERGPELVVPLKKLGLLRASAQGQGVTLQQTLHFHGNINSSYSVDEISRILGERTVQAIEKGRRF